MNIGIIDADLLDNGTRHPNLALMKISAYMKDIGHEVNLLHNYDNIREYDKVYLSQVFSFTKLPININEYDNLTCGGTGLYWDKAEPLPYGIEHHKPDYNLYDNYIASEVKRGIKENRFKDYKDYSIGFATRGCIRRCGFCINHNKSKVEKWSPITEFYDSNRKYIYLWDDNFLAFPKWNDVLDELEEVNKPFQFRQGLDLRLMTEEKAKRLAHMKYHGDYIFAFDNINDKDLIISKMKLWKKYCKKTTKLYVLCGFDRENKWDSSFWKQDIIDTFERIKILMLHGCLPYIMRFNRYEESPFRGTYINLARWCNQPNFFKKKSYRDFCLINGEGSATMRYLSELETVYPEIAKEYFDLRYEDLNQYK